MASGNVNNATPGKEEEYLAKPSGACCLKGFIHDGEPRGTFSTLTEIETYVVHPKSGSGNGNIILYFPDVWGMFTNGLLVMDSFAEAGYTVLGLDYFRGVSARFSLSDWSADQKVGPSH